MLISRRTFPPGGWQYFQPHTNWQAPGGFTFDQVVDALIKHRLANPRFKLPTEWDEVANELDEYTCLRLGNDPNYCGPGQFGGPPKKAPSPPRSVGGANVVAAAVETAKNTVAGIGIYLEWFGQGGPVAMDQAERRAAICLACPQNNTRLNLFQYFTSAVAGNLMKIMGILSDQNLRVADDAKLGICVACDCPTRAKIWSPIGIVLNHLRPESESKLDPRCWITSEKKFLEPPQT